MIRAPGGSVRFMMFLLLVFPVKIKNLWIGGSSAIQAAAIS